MADTFVKFLFGASVPENLTEGSLYFVSGDESIRLKMGEDEIRIGGIERITYDELQAKSEHNPNRFYFVTDKNALCVYDAESAGYIQFNVDTGATAVALTGAGNAVTGASYDAETRTVTLIKGETFATQAELSALDARVGAIPDGYTEETIVAYINKKAEETLNSATGGSSESAASVLAALNTYKAENDPKVAANTEAIEAIESDYLKAADKTELQGGIDAVAERMTTAESEIDALQEASAKHALAADLTAEVTRAKAAEEANASAAAAADAKAVAAQSDIDALEEKVGTVTEGKTVVEMIADAQAAATYDDTQVKADIKTNADAIAVLNGTGDGSVDKKITDAFNDFSTKVTDDAVVNSYKELIDWAAEHGSEAAEMAAAITTLQNILEGIGGEGESATVVAYVTAAIDALKIGDYAKAADLTALASDVATIKRDYLKVADKTALETAISDGDAATLTSAKEHATGLNTAMDTRVKAIEDNYLKAADKTELSAAITAGDDAVKALVTAEAETARAAEEALAGRATTLESEMDAAEGRLDALEAIDHDAYVAADETVLASAKEYVDGCLIWQSF